MKTMNTNKGWDFVKALTYKGEYFIIWSQPNIQKDGSIIINTKSTKSSREEIKQYQKQTVQYYAEL